MDKVSTCWNGLSVVIKNEMTYKSKELNYKCKD